MQGQPTQRKNSSQEAFKKILLNKREKPYTVKDNIVKDMWKHSQEKEKKKQDIRIPQAVRNNVVHLTQRSGS